MGTPIPDYQLILPNLVVHLVCATSFLQRVLCMSFLQRVLCTVVSHIYTYDRAQNILNFVQPLQKLIV